MLGHKIVLPNKSFNRDVRASGDLIERSLPLTQLRHRRLPSKGISAHAPERRVAVLSNDLI